MSTLANTSAPPTPTTPSTPKSKKNKKKKKGGNKTGDGDEQSRQNEELEELNQQDGEGQGDDESKPAPEKPKEKPPPHSEDLSVRSQPDDEINASKAISSNKDTASSVNGDPQARLDSLLDQRETLRKEVTELRKSLESIQSKHEGEINGLKEQVDAERVEKEEAQEQYQNLVGRVNTLRAEIQDRLKEDEQELSEARGEIESLQAKNATLKEEAEAAKGELGKLSAETEEQSKELSTLRNRTNLSQQNWNEERDSLVMREAHAREEFEQAKQAMQDWEILAVEERSQKQSLEEKVTELEEQLSYEKEEHEKAKRDRDTQANAVEGLQKGLQDIQEARKQELRDLVEDYEKQRTDLSKQLEAAQKAEKELAAKLKEVEDDNTRLQPLESEIKEKNLLIGKLKHEAVILNDHLTKALRQLRKGKTEDVIDRQLVTNHLLQFLSLSHGDQKKYQILQIMAAMLGWSDEQREQAGLSRPGASNPSLRAPISGWHRTPSTPTLSAANLGAATEELGRKESIAGLFSEFLESEAEGSSSKATSVSGSSKPTQASQEKRDETKH